MVVLVRSASEAGRRDGVTAGFGAAGWLVRTYPRAASGVFAVL